VRALLTAAFRAAIDAVDPVPRIAAVLPTIDHRPTRVIAAGKAAAAQIDAFLDAWPAPVAGLVSLPHGATPPRGAAARGLAVIAAGHPVPDAGSLTAGSRALAIAAAAPPDARLVVLLSGGASALLEALVPGVTPAMHRELSARLLAAGLPIDAINGLRRKLSRIKGGRLAAAFGGRDLLLLALSDVPGDAIADIGSGPCSPDPVTRAAALLTLRAIDTGAGTDAGIATRLEPLLAEPLPADHACFGKVRSVLIGRPAEARAAAASILQGAGFAVTDLGDANGPAAGLGRAHAAVIAPVAARGERRAFLSGGETTVAVTNPAGRGGRNTTYLLALGLALPPANGITALAADTDGIDGRGGHAGAFFDDGTRQRAAAAGSDAAAALAADDSANWFAAAGDLFVTGPTGTNVNDLRIVLSGTP
jgi:hydroxypyruvate reductase